MRLFLSTFFAGIACGPAPPRRPKQPRSVVPARAYPNVLALPRTFSCFTKSRLLEIYCQLSILHKERKSLSFCGLLLRLSSRAPPAALPAAQPVSPRWGSGAGVHGLRTRISCLAAPSVPFPLLPKHQVLPPTWEALGG